MTILAEALTTSHRVVSPEFTVNRVTCYATTEAATSIKTVTYRGVTRVHAVVGGLHRSWLPTDSIEVSR